MALGTAITVSALATLAVTAKNWAVCLAGDGRAGNRIHTLIEIGGAAFVFLLGSLLLTASLQRVAASSRRPVLVGGRVRPVLRAARRPVKNAATKPAATTPRRERSDSSADRRSCRWQEVGADAERGDADAAAIADWIRQVIANRGLDSEKPPSHASITVPVVEVRLVRAPG